MDQLVIFPDQTRPVCRNPSLQDLNNFEEIPAAKADEGGSVFIDQLTGSARKSFTPSYHPVNKKSPVIRVIG
jgi:hypothetical protein